MFKTFLKLWVLTDLWEINLQVFVFSLIAQKCLTITHPQKKLDLELITTDIDKKGTAFYWLLVIEV